MEVQRDYINCLGQQSWEALGSEPEMCDSLCQARVSGVTHTGVALDQSTAETLTPICCITWGTLLVSSEMPFTCLVK